MLAFLLFAALLHAQDLDKDGLDDQTEAALLQSHLPRFYLSAVECDTAPSEFTAQNGTPKATARNGTIYAQAFPATHLGPGYIELHYYHLWAKDCGRGGHPLDVEHASILLQNGIPAYHYTAAHEDTVCDVSMARKVLPGTRAAVYISAGKHASFLSPESCNSNGCGADRCPNPAAMTVLHVRNLGEPNALLPGMEWAASSNWPLAGKMVSDFTPVLLAQLDRDPGPVRTRPARRGAQTTVAVSSKPVDAVQTGARHTDSALHTGATQTRSFLGRAARGVGRFLTRP